MTRSYSCGIFARLALALLIAVTFSGSKVARCDAPAAGLDRAVIEELIRQLEDDEFAVRREATRRLGQAGLAAVAPLSKAAAGNSLETAFRALDALGKLAYSPETEVEDAAFAAMTELANSSHRTADRAKVTLANLREHYRVRAKDRLQELGASFTGARQVDDGTGEVIIAGGVGGGIIVRGRVAGAGLDMYYGNSVSIDENWKGTPRDLRLLARLSGLDLVQLSGPKITDECLAELKGLGASTVRHLELRKTKVTDAGIAHLAAIKSLTNVDIMHTPITDASLDVLGSLSELRLLRMYGTKVTAAATKALEAKLPNARIDRRGGALLGVGGAINEQPCIINTVQDGSAAAKAGILVDDVVLEFDGKTVQNFTELTAAISDKAGGEKVEIVLLRPTGPTLDEPPPPSRKQSVTVTLGEW